MTSPLLTGANMKDTTTSTLHVGIYAPVSTVEKGQDPENQLRQLRDYCDRHGWLIVQEYTDHLSGKSGDRPAFKRLLQDATQRRFDVLLVWAGPADPMCSKRFST